MLITNSFQVLGIYLRKMPQCVPVKGGQTLGASPAVPSPVRPSRKRGPSVVPRQRTENDTPLSSLVISQWVPEQEEPVAAASRTLPSAVPPSRKRGPSILLRDFKVNDPPPPSDTRHFVPVNGTSPFGARPTVPSAVRPSRYRAPGTEPREIKLTISPMPKPPVSYSTKFATAWLPLPITARQLSVCAREPVSVTLTVLLRPGGLS